MSKITLGLSKIEGGAIAVDGGMGTTLAAYGYTLRDTCKLTQEDPQVTEHFAEEVDEAIARLAKKGKTTVTFSIADPDATTMAALMGGTATAGVWSAPAVQPTIEQSLKITPLSGMVIAIPRASITAKLNGDFSSKGITVIEVTATVMAPTKADTAAITATPLA